MNHHRPLDLADEISSLVKRSLEPPNVFGLGEGSAQHEQAIAQWIGIMERDWQFAYDVATSTSPAALRLLHLIGAEFGFARNGRKLSLDGSSSALLSVLG